MKLEVGGLYKNRIGQVIKITKKTGGNRLYPYSGAQCEYAFEYSFTEHGGFIAGEKTKFDLVSEVKPKKKKKTHTVSKSIAIDKPLTAHKARKLAIGSFQPVKSLAELDALLVKFAGLGFTNLSVDVVKKAVPEIKKALEKRKFKVWVDYLDRMDVEW